MAYKSTSWAARELKEKPFGSMWPSSRHSSKWACILIPICIVWHYGLQLEFLLFYGLQRSRASVLQVRTGAVDPPLAVLLNLPPQNKRWLRRMLLSWGTRGSAMASLQTPSSMGLIWRWLMAPCENNLIIFSFNNYYWLVDESKDIFFFFVR